MINKGLEWLDNLHMTNSLGRGAGLEPKPNMTMTNDNDKHFIVQW